MDIILSALTSSLFWWIVKGATSNHLRIEPPGTTQAFFTGDNFFMTCLACEECRATRLAWQSPAGYDITNSHGRIHVEPAPHNPLGLELVFEELKPKDVGSYFCSAIVDGTEVRTKFNLIVHHSISFLGTPLEQNGVEGDDYLLRCSVRSDPSAIVSWYVNESLIQNDARRTLTEDGLFIRSLKRTDSSNYTCRAFVVTPHSSQMKDLYIRLNVHYRPVWRNAIVETAYGLIGGRVNLLCEAHSFPPPTFEWFRERTLLGNSRNYRITNHKWKSILEVKIIEQSSFGGYLCVASNNQGEAKRTLFILEGVFPGKPFIAVRSKEPGTLLVKMQPASKDTLPVLGYSIQYRLESEDWRYAKHHYLNRGHEVLFQDLNYETVYVVRARSRNAVGYGNYSDEVSQMTKGIVAETVMGGHSVSSQESSRAWTVNPSRCPIFCLIIFYCIIRGLFSKQMV